MQLEGPTAAGLMYSDTGGDGPVVVLLHGVLMSGTLWDTVVGGLGDRYRCIVPELPFGAHATPMPDDADLSLAALATMIAGFLTELDLRHVTVVCNDWGGAQHVISPGGTDRVANLVLVSCEAFDKYPPGVPGRLLCLNAALPGGTFLTAQTVAPTLDPPSPRDLRRPVAAAGSRRPLQELDPPAAPQPQRPQTPATPRVADQQRTFAGPVLIIWPRHDNLMPPTHAEQLAQHFQNTQLEWIDDTRILILINQPKGLTDHLHAFLTTNT